MVQIKHRYTGEVLLEVDSLQGDSLTGSNLEGANLFEEDMRGSYLKGVNLRGAYLEGVNFEGAYLGGVNFEGAYLKRAYLKGANLEGANLERAELPHYNIVPEEGGFYAWKKTSYGVIKIYVPADAKRCSSLVGRKCRASKVKVVSGEGVGGLSPNISVGYKRYGKGDIVEADKWDDDIRVECTHGIHFFMTKKEAEEW